ncbi:hypothetical protein K502DRAFT_368410 [Neoconidiobolus thromboides FSU 785]|nr:hypothetical protein K502DRAFT_368410 [Neoconidiobolus thromboides FSU 785]
MVAGALLLSPWVDIASTQPSIFTKNNDYLPEPNLKHEEILNVNGHFYTNEKYLKYPLVSPMYQDDFDKFPPVMATGGEERFLDEFIVFEDKIKHYKQIESDSQQVILHIYDEMPHGFYGIWFHPSSIKSIELSSQFIKDCFNNKSNNEPWACRIDTKLNLIPFDYDTTNYKIPEAFELKEEGLSVKY